MPTGFPAESLENLDVKRTLSRINWCFPWAVPMFHTMFAGLVLSQMCLSLHMSETEIGVVNAIPNLVLPFQLLSAYFLMKAIARKPLFLVLGVISRIFMLLIAVLIYGYSSWSGAIPLFMICFLGFHITFAMGIPLWFSWASDLVPKEKSSAFFGDRNAIAFISGMVYVIVYGLVLDKVSDLQLALALIMFVSGLLAMTEVWVYRSIPSAQDRIPKPLYPYWWCAPLKNEGFQKLVFYAVFYNLAFYLVMPFFFIYFKDLGYSSIMIQMGMGLHAIGVAVSSKLWALAAQKKGKRAVILYSGTLKVLVLLAFAFVDMETGLAVLILLFFLDGCTVGGWFTASFAMLVSETPQKERSTMMALFFSISGLAGFLASIASGLWMERWEGMELITMLGDRNSFQSLCLFAALLMPVGLVVFRKYRGMQLDF